MVDIYQKTFDFQSYHRAVRSSAFFSLPTCKEAKRKHKYNSTERTKLGTQGRAFVFVLPSCKEVSEWCSSSSDEDLQSTTADGPVSFYIFINVLRKGKFPFSSTTADYIELENTLDDKAYLVGVEYETEHKEATTLCYELEMWEPLTYWRWAFYFG